MTDDPIPPAPNHMDYFAVPHGIVLLAYPVAGDPVRLFIPDRWLPALVKVFMKRIRDQKVKKAK